MFLTFNYGALMVFCFERFVNIWKQKCSTVQQIRGLESLIAVSLSQEAFESS